MEIQESQVSRNGLVVKKRKRSDTATEEEPLLPFQPTPSASAVGPHSDPQTIRGTLGSPGTEHWDTL